MGKFTKIAKGAFDSIAMDAGVLLNTFDPEVGTISDEAIICATTGGIRTACTPEYQDQGDDVDNCPKNMKELKKLMSWMCTMGFTALNVTPETLRLALGAADVAKDKVTPRRNLDQSKDFKDLWWVGDRNDGGLVAVCLKNALSTGGLQLQTTKNGKGQLTVELTGHPTIETQDTVPMEFYSKDASPAAAAEVKA